jgi:hypothetical protein
MKRGAKCATGGVGATEVDAEGAGGDAAGAGDAVGTEGGDWEGGVRGA